jgi:glucoamylase
MTSPEPRLAERPPNSVDLTDMAGYFFPPLLRNIATEGYPFVAPTVFSGERPAGAPELSPEETISRPGCIIASPSFHENLPSIKQNYVYNWVRDAAIVAIELAAPDLPANADVSGMVNDYVTFAELCQSARPGELWRAKYTIAGGLVEGWPAQNDGPALQTLALLRLFPKLSPSIQDTARNLIVANARFVVDQHKNPNVNLWEEVYGQSFFTRSVQLRCLQELGKDDKGVSLPDGIDDTVSWLTNALSQHEDNGRYLSILDARHPRADYDPNSDIVLAALYGALSVTDPVLLNTASAIFAQYADPQSGYPINHDDVQRGIGPLLGRYPGDYYDGTHVLSSDYGATRGHPWAVCTSSYAELYYRVASVILGGNQVPDDPRAADFLAQAGTGNQDTPASAAAALCRAGDRMLQAIVYHSDNLELSEQFNAVTGYENSVRNLSWSYASFLSALRARADVPGGQGGQEVSLPQ